MIGSVGHWRSRIYSIATVARGINKVEGVWRESGKQRLEWTNEEPHVENENEMSQ